MIYSAFVNVQLLTGGVLGLAISSLMATNSFARTTPANPRPTLTVYCAKSEAVIRVLPGFSFNASDSPPFVIVPYYSIREIIMYSSLERYDPTAIKCHTFGLNVRSR